MSYLATVVRAASPRPAAAPLLPEGTGEPLREEHREVEAPRSAPYPTPPAGATTGARSSPEAAPPVPARAPEATRAHGRSLPAASLPAASPPSPSVPPAQSPGPGVGRDAIAASPAMDAVRTSVARTLADAPIEVDAALPAPPPARRAARVPAPESDPRSRAHEPLPMAVAAPVSSLLQASSEPAHGRAPDPAAPPPFVRAVARVAVRDPSDAGMHASGTASRPRAAAPQLHIGAIAITVKAPPPPSPAAPPVAAAAAPRARDGFAFSASRHHLRWS